MKLYFFFCQLSIYCPYHFIHSVIEAVILKEFHSFCLPFVHKLLYYKLLLFDYRQGHLKSTFFC